MSFYTEEEEKQRREYVPELRKKLLRHLDDLRHKINSNESFPESEQDIDSLVEIDDHIEFCLNKWYY
jgi:hypothetical protein